VKIRHPLVLPLLQQTGAAVAVVLLAVSALAPLVAAADGFQSQATNAYAQELERWRQDREAALKTDTGWLTLVGLVWLRDGANDVGSDPACPVRLPAGAAPARVGTFRFAAGTTTFVPAAGADVRINGQPATERVLQTESTRYDTISAGSVRMFVIKRGTRYGVRIRDLNSPARREFRGVKWFPAREDYRITARWVAHTTPTTIPIVNVLGDIEPYASPGYAVFSLGGREYTLHPVLDGPGARQLFFIFTDLTAGKDTYPAGRFLYASMPINGRVVLDFNRAISPPCAFTPFATCPLPPKENALALRIEAGELNPHK